jgi:hypothetical protein
MEICVQKNIGQLAGEIYELLQDQAPEDSVKILNSVTTLLGVEIRLPGSRSTPAGNLGIVASQGQNFTPPPANTGDAKSFFDLKAPQNKGEEFAVAALFRQQNGLGDTHKKEDIKQVIKAQARRTFDERNFVRDMKNAVRQAGFFIGGEARGEYLLSSHGESYANTLPDRKAAGELKKSTRSKRKSKKKVAK